MILRLVISQEKVGSRNSLRSELGQLSSDSGSLSPSSRGVASLAAKFPAGWLEDAAAVVSPSAAFNPNPKLPFPSVDETCCHKTDAVS